MNPRFDVEWALAPLFAQELINLLPDDAKTVSPVVTYFDPMSVDEANRIVVEIPTVTLQPESPGNFGGTCKVTAKSQWTQKTVKNDFTSHFSRVSMLRQALLSDELMDDVNALAAAGQIGITLDYIQPKREFETKVAEHGWIYSDMTFRFTGFFPAAT